MQHMKRTGFFMKNRLSSSVKPYYGLVSFIEHTPSKCVSNMGLAPLSSGPMEKTTLNCLTIREMLNLSCGRKYVRDVSHTPKVIHEAEGLPVQFKERSTRQHLVTFQSSLQPARVTGMNSSMPCFFRSFASKASRSTGQNQSEAKKDVSTVEDPFDAPTYNIPEKPMTFTEGASYSVIILAGLGVAAAAAYAVFKELIFEPKEYKIFGKALERIQNDGQVRVRIGAPITGYGSESRNRAARQRIPNRTWTDEDGTEHVEVNFYIRGPHGTGKVYSEMFKDKLDKQWKFIYLVVDIKTPSPAQLMLESYIPA